MIKIRKNLYSHVFKAKILRHAFFRYGSGSEDDSDNANGAAPAEEYLDEDSFSDPGSMAGAGRWVSPELSYLLNSFHMFGHFDKGVFLELCKHVETVHVPAGQYLFKVGDPDENVHVVQSGKVNVHIVDDKNRSNTIKVVHAGETVSSLLSFIDCLTGTNLQKN